MKASEPDSLKILDERRVRTVRVQWCDLHGLARGKRLSRAAFDQAIKQGLRFSTAPLVMDLHGETVDVALPFAQRGWPDMIARPDLSTLRIVPYEEATAAVVADLETTEGEPVDVAPRTVLRRVLEKTLAPGEEFFVGAELEFYVLPGDRWEPLPPGKQCFRMALGADEQTALSRLWELLPQMGLKVEASHPEDGAGQFEINLAPGSALAAADAAFIFRNAVKEIVAQEGLRATFMAKPFETFSGNGFHLHQSVRDAATGESAFSSSGDPRKPSEACRQFMAGQIAFAREAAAIYLPTVNSYKRTELRGPKPLSVCWDGDNRTVALRVLASDRTGVRVENRIAGADANPYLLIAAALATGSAGRAQGLEPPAPLCGDAYAADERGETLPGGCPRRWNCSIGATCSDRPSVTRSWRRSSASSALRSNGSGEPSQIGKWRSIRGTYECWRHALMPGQAGGCAVRIVRAVHESPPLFDKRRLSAGAEAHPYASVAPSSAGGAQPGENN